MRRASVRLHRNVRLHWSHRLDQIDHVADDVATVIGGFGLAVVVGMIAWSFWAIATLPPMPAVLP